MGGVDQFFLWIHWALVTLKRLDYIIMNGLRAGIAITQQHQFFPIAKCSLNK
jgi:hypothetical protein